jgi:hypothetical protein
MKQLLRTIAPRQVGPNPHVIPPGTAVNTTLQSYRDMYSDPLDYSYPWIRTITAV